MDLSGWIATGVALLSLGVSLWVALVQHRGGGRAHFTAEWETVSALIFTNQGPGSATNVSATLPNALRAATVEAEYMGAFQYMRFHVQRALNAPAPGPLTIAWKDNRRATQRAVIDLPEPPHLNMPRGGSELDKVIRAVATEEARRELERVSSRVARNRRRG